MRCADCGKTSEGVGIIPPDDACPHKFQRWVASVEGTGTYVLAVDLPVNHA
jgi:hypothetical protein